MTRSRERSSQEASHDLVLAVLRQATGAMTVRQVAAAVELSIATTRFHLTRLESAGLIRSGREQREHRPGRPRVLYTARRAEAVDAGAAYRHLAGVLAEQLMAVAGTAGALDAGRAWAERLSSGAEVPSDDRAVVEGPPDATDRIVRLLDDTGFTPTLSADRRLIELHSCPFMSLAEERADVVCTVHLGLIQGLLTNRPGQDVRVRPVLDGSGPCLVELPADQPRGQRFSIK
jgi:predicted ArsR family transcriptional regulator